MRANPQPEGISDWRDRTLTLPSRPRVNGRLGARHIDDYPVASAMVPECAKLRRVPPGNSKVVRDYRRPLRELSEKFSLQSRVFAGALVYSYHARLRQVDRIIVRLDYGRVPEAPRLRESDGAELLALLNPDYLPSAVE